MEAAGQAEAAEAAGEPSVPARAVSPALERIPGIDLAARVLELAAERSLSVFFLGAGEGVAAEAARRQVERLPGLLVAGTRHGYFDPAREDEVVQVVRDSGAQILLVAMGAPKQEVFLYRWREWLGAGVALGVGGSFDVWAGKVRRAPGWTQAAKIEWLYRLVADPRRFRRQMALPRFAAEVVLWSPDDYGPPRRGRAAGSRPGKTGAATATVGKSGGLGREGGESRGIDS
jgi:N-acetylglucosaminyldiphosphoundecaprenol N-acetyl-beta-D-mannosaminyltransferase